MTALRMVNRTERKVVKPTFVRGVGRWMLVLCPSGHLLNQLPYGSWVDGQKAIKASTVTCAKCAREEA